MCSNESPPPRKEPLAVGLDARNPMAGFLPSLEHYRYIYHYAMAERFRLAQQLHPQQHPGVPHPSGGSPTGPLAITTGFPAPLPLYPAAGYPGRLALSMALLHPHHPRIPEEPKPQHSYIGLIGMAILSSPEKKLVLSDIYQHILDHYSYFRNRGPGWRNSIRHNLSLNDCFVKSGRSANGKGHYWAIHPANIEDFRRGDFRRRKAQQKVRRHMGLAVDEEPDSPSPPPLPASPPPSLPLPLPLPSAAPSLPAIGSTVASQGISVWMPPHHHRRFHARSLQTSQPARKRQFDVASLLAPDDHIDALDQTKLRRFSCSEDENDPREPEPLVAEDHGGEEDVDVDGVVEPGVPTTCSPSSSPVSKPSPTDRCWTSPSLHQTPTSTPFAAIHLHNHLHVRNYYAPTTNPGSGSSV